MIDISTSEGKRLAETARAIASTQGILSALAMSSILPAVSSATLVYAVLAKARNNH